VDDGARTALLQNQKSLLPSGIMEICGDFKANDTISIRDTAGKEIAKGVTWFSSADLGKIKGRKTSEIEKILGRQSPGEVVHRDNLVLIGEE
jgi:glutamate 5-kinase